IREMQNVIERAVILSAGPALRIPTGDLQPPSLSSVQPDGRDGRGTAAPDVPANTPITLADAERDHILSALRESGWVLGGPNGAAVRLAMKRTTLQSKMKKLAISRPK